jgi:periplasmic divalent cation tolerance protein
MPTFIQVVTTLGKQADAQRIAQAVVQNRLAACAQVFGPISSTYWWNDRLETAEEWYCLIKSTDDLYDELEAAIRRLHPYDVPEIVALPVLRGSKSYLDWLSAEVCRPGQPDP